jgi:hypothetical protein
MRALAAMLFVGGLLAVASLGTAQPPEGGKEGPKGGKGDKGPGGKGGRGDKGGRFGPPPVGQVLPPFVQDQLKLTADQKKELEAIQKDVDARLNKLLTDDQKQQLKQMRERGPFGGRFPGGPGGRGPGEKGGKGGNPPPKKDNKDE